MSDVSQEVLDDVPQLPFHEELVEMDRLAKWRKHPFQKRCQTCLPKVMHNVVQ